MAGQYRFVATALLCALVLGTSAPEVAAAGDEPTQSQAGEPNKTAEAPKMVCTRELVIGTNISRKVCRTQKEADALQDASQRTLRDLQDYGGVRGRGDEG